MDLNSILYSILFIIIGILAINYIDNRVKVRSTVDGQEYLVRNFPNKVDAANTLAKIKQNVINFNKYLQANYPEDPRVINIKNRLNIKSFRETPRSDSLTSFSMNKGEIISFCLRVKENPIKIHPVNVLMFVTIHELAHVASEEYGHGKEFYDNFEWLLNKAEEGGFYFKEDFNAKPFVYCGVKITHELI